MVLKVLESKCTDSHPPPPLFWNSTPMRSLPATQKRFHSLVLASPLLLPLTRNELTAFKPNDVMCIRASNTFSCVKKVLCVLRCSNCKYFGRFDIYIFLFFKKQESGCKLILTFFSICVKHMFQKNRREKLSLTGKL